ncbi:MAG: SnRNP, putative [Archaeoglobus fulgidus]|uniref:SnRNP, putative n=2 Tax=Archaeoglobus TaxID=2233 RepID=A0A101DEX4_ARCFL|nr:MAG: SnRNP, putative [Archaeoglobus fulgidus]KUK06363.1 MAG: SnRNP, putative [Archaeoglobus fulgidus]
MLPNQMVKSMVGKIIRVEMKGEENQLVGKLEGVDDYMNLYLTNAMEYKGEEKVRSLGEIVLRGNNVVLIQPQEEWRNFRLPTQEKKY